jgi:hypothetical protein
MPAIRTRPQKPGTIERRWTLAPAIIIWWFVAGCVSPIQELWPPGSNAPSYPIYVSLDTWHAMIGFSEGERKGREEFEEWGYAERAWYLEGQQGLTGVLRALFWPTEGVIEVGLHDQLWAARTPQPPADLFVFRVSAEGYRRLRRHLLATIAKADPVVMVGGSKFYSATRSYHVFHTCHQYAASALREAGLPMAVWWAFTRTALALQLKRAARMDEVPIDILPGERAYP